MSYVIVLCFAVMALLLVGSALTIGRILRPHRPNAKKNAPYESGNVAVGSAHIQFHIRYYMYALMFLIFDVEVVFIVPWAVAFGALGSYATGEMIVFIGVLALGLLYAYKKKVLVWQDA